MTARALVEQAKRLPLSKRLHLIGQLWETIPESAIVPVLTASERKELVRRWRDHRKHPEKCMAWEDVKKQMRPRAR
jgi:putative addiction module component (TIGR02574 family)